MYNITVTGRKLKPTIIEFSPEHASAVKSFLLSILEGEFGHINVPRPDLDDIENYYQVDSGNFWIALDSTQVVGTVGLKDYGHGIGFIQRMSVLNELRGTGVAQVLLHKLEEFAHEHMYASLYLATSENLQAANHFYPKERYEQVASLPPEIPTPIAKMYYKKDL